MTDLLPWILIGLQVVIILLLAVLVLRIPSGSAERAAEALRTELRAGREESARGARELRDEVAGRLGAAVDSSTRTLAETVSLQRTQLEHVASELKNVADRSREQLDQLRSTIDTQLRQIQDGNEKKLEEMRQTVDEKLQGTLERRLGESFKLVSDRLEAVQRGLGEMQSLAAGVGDLKRVLTNVKSRGTWGEVQLGAILEQLLTPDQYARNVETRAGSNERVEYAVRLPGLDGDGMSPVWLPIDAKFPQEDYARLQEAAEAGDADGVCRATDALARTARVSAQAICGKYLNPPHTTDFALMFVPTEGLYAEILRQPALVENLQQATRVVVVGPTTLAAVLSSLRMGFRSVAIEKRASEVWAVLGAVKTEFGKFGETLDRVGRQLDNARGSIDDTTRRTRAMERKLRAVESLPTDQAAELLELRPEERDLFSNDDTAVEQE